MSLTMEQFQNDMKNQATIRRRTIKLSEQLATQFSQDLYIQTCNTLIEHLDDFGSKFLKEHVQQLELNGSQLKLEVLEEQVREQKQIVQKLKPKSKQVQKVKEVKPVQKQVQKPKVAKKPIVQKPLKPIEEEKKSEDSEVTLTEKGDEVMDDNNMAGTVLVYKKDIKPDEDQFQLDINESEMVRAFDEESVQVSVQQQEQDMINPLVRQGIGELLTEIQSQRAVDKSEYGDYGYGIAADAIKPIIPMEGVYPTTFVPLPIDSKLLAEKPKKKEKVVEKPLTLTDNHQTRLSHAIEDRLDLVTQPDLVKQYNEELLLTHLTYDREQPDMHGIGNFMMGEATAMPKRGQYKFPDHGLDKKEFERRGMQGEFPGPMQFNRDEKARKAKVLADAKLLRDQVMQEADEERAREEAAALRQMEDMNDEFEPADFLDDQLEKINQKPEEVEESEQPSSARNRRQRIYSEYNDDQINSFNRNHRLRYQRDVVKQQRDDKKNPEQAERSNNFFNIEEPEEVKQDAKVSKRVFIVPESDAPNLEYIRPKKQ